MSQKGMSNWTRTTRGMLRSVSEIGAKPFVLFQYYLTWQHAKDGIFPGLKRIADDLNMTPSAICNLRNKLISAGWIRVENGEILILKTFTKNEESSPQVNNSFTKNEKSSLQMNGNSQKMNPDSQKMNGIYKEEILERKTRKKNEKRKPQTVEDLITELRDDPFYTGINIDREVTKMRRWLSQNPNRKFTKKFATNWLDKVEPEISLSRTPTLHKGCPLCLHNEYVSRMSLRPGEVFDPARKKVVSCECVK